MYDEYHNDRNRAYRDADITAYGLDHKYGNGNGNGDENANKYENRIQIEAGNRNDNSSSSSSSSSRNGKYGYTEKNLELKNKTALNVQDHSTRAYYHDIDSSVSEERSQIRKYNASGRISIPLGTRDSNKNNRYDNNHGNDNNNNDNDNNNKNIHFNNSKNNENYSDDKNNNFISARKESTAFEDRGPRPNSRIHLNSPSYSTDQDSLSSKKINMLVLIRNPLSTMATIIRAIIVIIMIAI